jgi:hypothetical protein
MSGLIAGAILVGASFGGGVGAGTAPSDECRPDSSTAECLVEGANDAVRNNPNDVVQGGQMVYDATRGAWVRRAAPAADDGVRVVKPLVVGAGAVGAGATGVAVAKHQKKKNQAS